MIMQVPEQGGAPSANTRRKWIWHGIPLTVSSCLLITIVCILAPGPIEALCADYEGDLDEPLSRRALGQYELIQRNLGEPFDGYGFFETFVPQFQVVLLSHAACGLVNVARADQARRAEVAAMLDEIAERA